MPNPYKKPEGGGAAFPTIKVVNGVVQSPDYEEKPLTRREYFAAQAIASGQLLDAGNLALLLGENVRQMSPQSAAEAAARSAYNIADAMIKLADKPVLTAERGKS